MFNSILVSIVGLILVITLACVGLVLIKINETLAKIEIAINNHKGGPVL